ncbi:MAG: biosynthetic-type acetolactate synthase large subunit [Sphaerochaetaceae bacterium]|jgi:acetolactate synthase-1/2/3 large subunit|nr:biosynthetic-type acetolactate synthase large subunit [Sphaerochaetaceae bacterium]MDD2406341.1 biosynthetic-type acetolactate synthase large subunit [Sphaerochaetaceae bacterium]MDD3670866.1 biosynthetic-type acetolactate synthase large subunit [Sphaerochaetaceae bacterium]MDD4259132.1 biosynthetic-type acetolactate synthase large subunit [Sphaerochaetaceae bacterium]NLO59461.1 biosynthetic-type acetolactate synthase large subunit [Spirochaetales bacterium]
MKLNGSEILIECLIEQQVDTVFGFPGGAVLNIYDALYKYRSSIRHILTSHEQGASHAADGYARSTGKVGVCIATSGPGATNLVTGLATAYMDSIPIVAFTGNVTTALLGKDSFQEVDITGITMPITKHNYIVKDVRELAPTIREAFRIARSGRPGPVLIDVPKDVSAAICDYEKADTDPIIRLRPMQNALEKTIKMLRESVRPMLYVGGGVIRANAQGELAKFIELIDSPMGVSFMGTGAVACDHVRFTGMIGMHGTRVSNIAVNRCDLLLVIGARFSDRVVSKASAFAKKAKIVQIDVDPAEINKNMPTLHHVIGDIKEVLGELNTMLERSPIVHTSWMEQIALWKQEYPIKVSVENRRSKQVLRALNQLLPENAIIVTEVGQHQMWTAQFYCHNPKGRFLSSGGLGTMGYGTGAAIGAQVGNLDKRVVNVAGDGSFRMNCNELATIARYNLPIIILLMNNHTLGMVRQWQTFFYEHRYSETTLDTSVDWIKLAQAYGINGMHLGIDDDPAMVLNAAISLHAPVLVDCEIPVDNKVFPMVAPGASIDDMIEDSPEQ